MRHDISPPGGLKTPTITTRRGLKVIPLTSGTPQVPTCHLHEASKYHFSPQGSSRQHISPQDTPSRLHGVLRHHMSHPGGIKIHPVTSRGPEDTTFHLQEATQRHVSPLGVIKKPTVTSRGHHNTTCHLHGASRHTLPPQGGLKTNYVTSRMPQDTTYHL